MTYLRMKGASSEGNSRVAVQKRPLEKSVQKSSGWPKKSVSALPQPHPQYAALQALFDTAAFEQRFAPESTIILHGEPATALYLVVSGTVRCCTIDPEGGRQIFSFAQKGDYVGVSDIDTSHFTAEAIDYVIAKSIPRSVVEQTLAVNIALREDMRRLMRDLLMQREKQLFSLISHKAPKRLLSFLQDYSTSRLASGFVTLPMSRQDIGDHLGMTMETASRAFSALKAGGEIEMSNANKYRIIG